MQLRIKRAFYKDLAINNPHLKIRSFRKRKNHIGNYHYEAVRVRWSSMGWDNNLYFYFDLNGKTIETKLELTNKSDGASLGVSLVPEDFLNHPHIPQEIRDWAMFNIDVIK